MCNRPRFISTSGHIITRGKESQEAKRLIGSLIATPHCISLTLNCITLRLRDKGYDDARLPLCIVPPELKEKLLDVMVIWVISFPGTTSKIGPAM